MNKSEVFQILGIEETKEEASIKDAYRTKLVHTNPEDDPEGFQALREAYENAIRLINEDEAEDNREETEVDLWIHRAEEIYRLWSTRLDIDNWKKLFEEEVCVALDTSDEATEKFLVFLMDHYNFTNEIWKEIDATFDYLNLKSEIREKFPPNFYDFVCNQIRYNSFLDYDKFEGADDGDYDKAIDTYYEIKRTLDSGNQGEVNTENLIAQLDSYEIYHPYFETEKLRYELLKEQVSEERVLSYVEKLSSYGEDFYITCYLCEAYLYLKDDKKAKDYIEKSRELNPNFMGGQICEIKYFMAVEDYAQAKEKSTDYLDQYGNREEGLYYMHEANEKLMVELRKKADAGDVDSFMELGWCLFQNEEFDECISMLEEYTPDDEHVFDYNNLRGRCTLAAGDYNSALPYLIKWMDALEKLTDDGTEKYQKRIRRLGYAHYTVAMCYASKADEVEQQGNADNKMNYYRMAKKHLNEAIRTEKEEREVLYYKERMAYVLTKSGEDEEAIKLCDQIVEQEPQYYPAYCDRQMAYYNLRNGQGVIDDFYNAIEIYAGNVEPYILAIKAFLGYSQYDDAENIVNRALENQIQSDELTLQQIIVKRCKWDGEDKQELQVLIDELNALKKKIEAAQEESDIEEFSDIDYQIGITYWNMGQIDKAIESIDRAESIHKLEKHLWAKADIYERNQKYQEEYDTYVELGPSVKANADRLYRMGRCLQRMGRSEEQQLKMFQSAYEADSSHFAVNDCIADIYHDRYNRNYQIEDYQKALWHACKQIEVNPSAYVLINRGLIYLDGGELEKAMEDFYKAMEYDPQDIYAYNNAGYTYKRMKQYDKALEYYQKGLECETSESKRILYRNMYILHLIQGNYEEAEKLLDVFIQNDRTMDGVVEMIDELYSRQGKYQKGISIKDSYEDKISDKMAFHVCQAEDYIRLGDLKTAKSIYKKMKKIIKADSSDKREKENMEYQFFKSMGNYYEYGERDIKKAAEMYEKAIALKKYIELYRDLCRIYKKMNKEKEVQFYYKEAVSYIQNRYQSVENFLAYKRLATLDLFVMGEIYYYAGEYDKARECFDKMDEEKPCSMCHFDRCYEKLIGQGLILKMEGKKEQALAMFRQAAEVDRTDLESREQIKELEK